MGPASGIKSAAKAAALAGLLLSVIAPTAGGQSAGGIEYGAPPPGSKMRYAGHAPGRDADSELATVLDRMLSAALLRSAESTQLDREVTRYSARAQKSRFGAQDILQNYLGLPRGFDYSEEGARLVLDEDTTVKNLEAAVWGKQLRADQLHEQLVVGIMELASGLGSSDPRSGQRRMQSALSDLSLLCGPENAAQAADMLACWSQDLNLSDGAFDQKVMSLSEAQSKAQMAAAIAFDHDLSMIAVKNKLHSYSNHSRVRQVGGKVVEGTVSAVTMLGPGLAIPVAAQVAGATWGMANGGSEETKLLKELYYQKQVDSRKRVLEVEAHTALLGLREAVQTRNQPLLILSESMLAQLVGASGMPQILPVCSIDHRLIVSRTIAMPPN